MGHNENISHSEIITILFLGWILPRGIPAAAGVAREHINTAYPVPLSILNNCILHRFGDALIRAFGLKLLGIRHIYEL